MKTFDYECPDCGGAMKLRTNKKTHEQFWGCTFYPECTGTRRYDGEPTPSDAPDEIASERLARNDRHRWRHE